MLPLSTKIKTPVICLSKHKCEYHAQWIGIFSAYNWISACPKQKTHMQK